MRILQVEDDQATAKIVEQVLSAKGYDCETTAYGEEAVGRAISGTYDLILLDIMLPGIDGYEVLRRLAEAAVQIPVIIQTGLISRDQADKGVSLGTEYYLLKPFNAQDLSACVDAALGRSGGLPRTMGHRAADEFDRRKSERATGASRRRHPRKRTLMSGQVIYDDGRCMADCLVINISESGAAIQFTEYFAYPSTFILKLSRGANRRCEVCWLRGNKAGVRFLAPQ